jgi:hypothetical protein
MVRMFNIIEVASELTHKDLVTLVGGEHFECELWEDPESDVLTYTDEYQDKFNDLYDEYFSNLFNLSEEI